VSQWLTAYERATAEVAKAASPAPAKPAPASAPKPKKLSFHEQKEWEGIEAAITAAEQAVTAREAEVASASTSGNHVVLAAACKALEEAQAVVEKLYTRWQELEAKRSSTS
jgi:ATP-binding cassette subfamily F protein uup